MSRSLALLKAAVNDELDNVAELIPDSFIERSLNEGQRRMEPDIVLESVLDITWDDAAASVALPSDFIELTALDPDSDHTTTYVRRYRIHAGSLWFDRPDLVYGWAGRIFYQAHFPRISDDQSCLLDEDLADGIVSYALYKAYKRLASNRTDYRKFATLVNNATSVDDLLAIADSHLQDWRDVIDSSRPARQPDVFYGS